MVFIKEDVPGKFLCLEKISVKFISKEPNSCDKRWVLYSAYNPE